jgi:hypothetical protein
MHKQHKQQRLGHIEVDTMKLVKDVMDELEKRPDDLLFPDLSIDQIEDKFSNYLRQFKVQSHDFRTSKITELVSMVGVKAT